MPSIVVLDAATINYGDLSWERLKSLGEVVFYDNTSDDLIIERAKDAEIVLGNKIKITRDVIDHLPNLKLYCCMATGYNVVDVLYAEEKGITVCNIPSYSTASVVQLVFALLLELCIKIRIHDRVSREKWFSSPMFNAPSAPMIELDGKTMGIIGFGNIGQSVSKVALAFGMKPLVFSKHIKSGTHEEYPGVEFTNLETMLKKSDVISLNCALTEDTTRIINVESLKLIKDGALLINTARGMNIDEYAVKDALLSGKLGGYGADVQTIEPPSKDSPMLNKEMEKYTVFTPHIGFATKEARERLIEILCDNIDAWLKGEKLNVVTKK